MTEYQLEQTIKSGPNNLSDRGHAELLVLYQTTVDDIARTKQQLWRDFYAVLVAQGGLMGLYRAIYQDLGFTWMHCLLFALPVVLSALGITAVCVSRGTVEQQRGLVERYQERLDAEIKRIIFGPHGSPRHRPFYPAVAITVLALAGILVFILMLGLKLGPAQG